MLNPNTCSHCGEKIVIPSKLKLKNEEYLFCCNGCKTVFEILHDKGFQEYYRLKKTSDSISNPVVISEEKYLYLDDKDFLSKYTKQINNTHTMKFYLEGIHCVACLWLIEKLPEFIPGVLSSELNMSKSTCTVTTLENVNFSDVAKQFEMLGYKPHPVLETSEIEALAKKEDRKMLIKIAVAFASAGNIMLLAISLYAGLEEHYLKEYFRWLNFYLSLPVLLYSATPFYHSAFTAVKNRKISIDIPIVVAIILVTIAGVISLFQGTDHLYFDSITVLVFLLLFARYVLKKAQQKSLSATEVSSFFANQFATRINSETGIEEVVHAKFLNKLEKIIVRPGQNIPVDGLVLEGDSNINSSLLTGESLPEKVTKGSYVYSGTINLDKNLIVQVLNTPEESRLGKILESVESGWNQKADIVEFSDRIARYLVYTVFSLSIIIIFIMGFYDQWAEGMIRALTLIIITCPCALGLTTPLALTLTLGRLAKVGIIIKNEKVIEKLTKAKRIFLDKTGTLTYGSFQVVHFKSNQQIKNFEDIIFALESRSKHPIAKSITQYLEKKYYEQNIQFQNISIDNFKEIPGIGVYGEVAGVTYEIKASDLSNNQTTTNVGIYQNAALVGEIQLRDEIRLDAKKSVDLLKKFHLKPMIISGDNQLTVNEVAKVLDIPFENAKGRVSPEEKNSIIQSHDKSVMVGDGANDAIALSSAFVGIAVHGSVDIALRAADVYISKSGVRHVLDLLTAANETMRVIRRNLVFSLVYNIIGTACALLGLITPLFAAILMPLSSLTVLISTFISTKKLNELDKIK
jgi:heavy metal translocating P-type ATPase